MAMSTGWRNRSATRSLRCSRTLSRGCSCWNSSSQGSSTLRPKSEGADSCSTPAMSSRPPASRRCPSARLSRALRAWARNCSPSGVRRRLRVERTKSRASSCCSRRLSAALATAGETSSLRAAAERLPWSAVRTNRARSSRRNIFKNPLKGCRFLADFSRSRNNRPWRPSSPLRRIPMKAVAYFQNLPIDNPEALQDIVLPEPQPGPRDLLVEVRAISVNPVDTKVRRNAAPETGQPRVLGWDVAGVVKAVGGEVSLFRPGDRVFYAGDLTRQGGNAELHRVDERIVGHMPESLDFAAAAALPLTSITAWELLFDRLQIAEGKVDLGQSLLVVGAAGGVGSILVQQARQLTGLTVI